MFVEFTDQNNQKILINTEKIFLIKKSDAIQGTVVMSQGGAIALVKESVEAVQKTTETPDKVNNENKVEEIMSKLKTVAKETMEAEMRHQLELFKPKATKPKTKKEKVK